MVGILQGLKAAVVIAAAMPHLGHTRAAYLEPLLTLVRARSAALHMLVDHSNHL